MSLRGIINTTLTNSSAALSVAFNDTHNSTTDGTDPTTDGTDPTTDGTTDPYYGGSLAGNIIVGIIVFIFVACIIQSYCRGGCDSNDTNGARVHRARCRQAARGQGAYAL